MHFVVDEANAVSDVGDVGNVGDAAAPDDLRTVVGALAFVPVMTLP